MAIRSTISFLVLCGLLSLPIVVGGAAQNGSDGPYPMHGYMLGDNLYRGLGDSIQLRSIADRTLQFGSTYPRFSRLVEDGEGGYHMLTVKADPFADGSTDEGFFATAGFGNRLADLQVNDFCTFRGPIAGAEKGFAGLIFGVSPNFHAAIGDPGVDTVEILSAPGGSTPSDPSSCVSEGNITPGLVNFGLRLEGTAGPPGKYILGGVAFGTSGGGSDGSLSFFEFDPYSSESGDTEGRVGEEGSSRAAITPIGTIDGTQNSDLWPSILSRISDLNGDAVGEFLISSEFRTPPIVRIVDGTTATVLGAAELNDAGFGAIVHRAGTDADGNGKEDIYVGATDRLLLLSTEALLAAGTAPARAAGEGAVMRRIEAPEAGGDFGSTLTTGLFNGDSVPDVATAAPFQDPGGLTDAGSVFLFDGTDGSLIQRIDGGEADDQLGMGVANHSITPLGDLGPQDGIQELGISAPGNRDMFIAVTQDPLPFDLFRALLVPPTRALDRRLAPTGR